MKRITLLLCGIFAASGCAEERWEYLTVESADSTLNANLDSLGGEGWELVSVTDEMIFKRPARRISSGSRETPEAVESVDGAQVQEIVPLSENPFWLPFVVERALSSEPVSSIRESGDPQLDEAIRQFKGGACAGSRKTPFWEALCDGIQAEDAESIAWQVEWEAGGREEAEARVADSLSELDLAQERFRRRLSPGVDVGVIFSRAWGHQRVIKTREDVHHYVEANLMYSVGYCDEREKTPFWDGLCEALQIEVRAAEERVRLDSDALADAFARPNADPCHSTQPYDLIHYQCDLVPADIGPPDLFDDPELVLKSGDPNSFSSAVEMAEAGICESSIKTPFWESVCETLRAGGYRSIQPAEDLTPNS